MYYPNGELIKCGDLIVIPGSTRKKYQTSVELAVIIWVRTNSLFVLVLMANKKFRDEQDSSTTTGINSPAKMVQTNSKNELYTNFEQYNNFKGRFMFIEGFQTKDIKASKTTLRIKYNPKIRENSVPIRYFFKTDEKQIPFELKYAYDEAQRFIKERIT